MVGGIQEGRSMLGAVLMDPCHPIPMEEVTGAQLKHPLPCPYLLEPVHYDRHASGGKKHGGGHLDRLTSPSLNEKSSGE